MGKIENFLWDKIYNGRYDADKCWNIALKNGYVKESDKRAFFKKHAELEKMYQERYGNIIPESKANKNMKKNVVKINESTLRNMIANSIKKALKEDIAMKKQIHETPQIKVKQYGNYKGRDPKGIN